MHELDQAEMELVVGRRPGHAGRREALRSCAVYFCCGSSDARHGLCCRRPDGFQGLLQGSHGWRLDQWHQSTQALLRSVCQCAQNALVVMSAACTGSQVERSWWRHQLSEILSTALTFVAGAALGC